MSSPAPLPLSRQRVLACAVEIADRDGLEAASLRRVASELGVHVTSLYNHVPTKEALLDGIIDEMFAGSSVPVGEFSWEQWVRRFVAAVAEVARQHPGAFSVLLRRPVQSAEATATFESGLAAFRRAGLSTPEAYGAVKSVALAVLGCCVEQAFAATGSELSTDVSRLSWRDFPVLHEVTSTDQDIDIVAMLTDVLVAGFEHRIASS